MVEQMSINMTGTHSKGNHVHNKLGVIFTNDACNTLIPRNLQPLSNGKQLRIQTHCEAATTKKTEKSITQIITNQSVNSSLTRIA